MVMNDKTLLNSKLLQLYQVLTKPERRAFKKWLYSPIHNEHKGVQQIFQFLDSRQDWTRTTLQRQRLWEYLSPHLLYDDGRLRYLLSLSLDVLTEFMTYYTAKEQRLDWQNRTVRYLAERKLPKLAKKEIQKAQRLAAQHYPDADLHYQQFELEQWQFELEGTQNRTRNTNIGAIAEHATLFFVHTTLRYACIAFSHHTIKNTEYTLPMLDAVLQEVEQHPERYQNQPLILLYYHAYFALKGDETHFRVLDEYRQTCQKWMQHRERLDMTLAGINYCIRQINTGNMNYLRPAWEWYKTGLEERLLLDNNTLSLFSYTNVVAIGVKIGEFDWVERFLKEYSSYLPTEHQLHYQSYNSAKLCFAKGELEKAMDYLTQTEYTDLLLNLESKVLLLKIYYEAAYYDALDALLNSFRIFLGRKTKVLTPSRKENYRNLIRLTKQLMNLQPNPEARTKLRTAIENTYPLAERVWLLAQL